NATTEIAGPRRSGLDIKLSLPFGLLSQSIELRVRGQELVQRVGDDLLRRAAADGTRESQLKVPLRVQTKSKRRFALAASRSARLGRAPQIRAPRRRNRSDRLRDSKGFGMLA